MAVSERPVALGGAGAATEAETPPASPEPGARSENGRRGSFVLTGILVLLCVHTVVWAWAFFLPFTLSLTLYFLFMPLVRAFRRAGVVEWVSSALIVLTAVALLVLGSYALARPATDWLARAPQSLEKLERRFSRMAKPLEQVNKTAQKIEELASGGTPVSGLRPPARPGVASALLGGAQQVLDGIVVVAFLVYFLLASGDLFLRKIVKVLPTFRDKVRAVEIAREMEGQISSYLVSHTLLNVALGVATGLLCWLLGMPNPLLWAVLAAVTNYVPILGGLFTNVALALASLLTFDTTSRAVALPLAFLVLNTLEANVAYPLVVGKRMALNPPVVFVAVMFWLWAWGVVGALLAVPILAALKVLCDHVEGWGPLAELLGEGREKAASPA